MDSEEIRRIWTIAARDRLISGERKLKGYSARILFFALQHIICRKQARRLFEHGAWSIQHGVGHGK